MNDLGASSSKVVAAADAMREKRRELIAQPLDRIWVQLARAAVEASDRIKLGTGSESATGLAQYKTSLPARESSSEPSGVPWSKELIKEIAMDIGKDTVAYVEVMYPKAIEATSSSFKLSLRNHIYNQIMAAIEVNDAGEIKAMLAASKKHRREWLGMYRKMRLKDKDEEVGR